MLGAAARLHRLCRALALRHCSTHSPIRRRRSLPQNDRHVHTLCLALWHKLHTTQKPHPTNKPQLLCSRSIRTPITPSRTYHFNCKPQVGGSRTAVSKPAGFTWQPAVIPTGPQTHTWHTVLRPQPAMQSRLPNRPSTPFLVQLVVQHSCTIAAVARSWHYMELYYTLCGMVWYCTLYCTLYGTTTSHARGQTPSVHLMTCFSLFSS